MAVFELVFVLLARVMQGRIKEYSIGFQEGENVGENARRDKM